MPSKPKKLPALIKVAIWKRCSRDFLTDLTWSFLWVRSHHRPVKYPPAVTTTRPAQQVVCVRACAFCTRTRELNLPFRSSVSHPWACSAEHFSSVTQLCLSSLSLSLPLFPPRRLSTLSHFHLLFLSLSLCPPPCRVSAVFNKALLTQEGFFFFLLLSIKSQAATQSKTAKGSVFY